jgi:hypothetical protein
MKISIINTYKKLNNHYYNLYLYTDKSPIIKILKNKSNFHSTEIVNEASFGGINVSKTLKKLGEAYVLQVFICCFLY